MFKSTLKSPLFWLKDRFFTKVRVDFYCEKAAPAVGNYNYIRQKLVENFTESQQKRLQRVLKVRLLDDRQPSKLYNKMRRTAGPALSESILHDLWINRLPPYIHAPIIARTRNSKLQIQSPNVWPSRRVKFVRLARNPNLRKIFFACKSKSLSCPNLSAEF